MNLAEFSVCMADSPYVNEENILVEISNYKWRMRARPEMNKYHFCKSRDICYLNRDT